MASSRPLRAHLTVNMSKSACASGGQACTPLRSRRAAARYLSAGPAELQAWQWEPARRVGRMSAAWGCPAAIRTCGSSCAGGLSAGTAAQPVVCGAGRGARLHVTRVVSRQPARLHVTMSECQACYRLACCCHDAGGGAYRDSKARNSTARGAACERGAAQVHGAAHSSQALLVAKRCAASQSLLPLAMQALYQGRLQGTSATGCYSDLRGQGTSGLHRRLPDLRKSRQLPGTQDAKPQPGLVHRLSASSLGAQPYLLLACSALGYVYNRSATSLRMHRRGCALTLLAAAAYK